MDDNYIIPSPIIPMNEDEIPFYENQKYLYQSDENIDLNNNYFFSPILKTEKEEKQITTIKNNIFLNKKIERTPEEDKNDIVTQKYSMEGGSGSENGSKPKKRPGNKITKIKTFYLNSFQNFINKLLLEKYKEINDDKKLILIELDPFIKETIAKKDNIKLFDITFKTIFKETSVTTKYKTEEKKNNNSKIINKIFNEWQDESLMKLLNLKFIEGFEIFIRDIKEMSKELKKNTSTFNKNLKKKLFNYKYFEGVMKLYDNIRIDFKNKKTEVDIIDYIYGKDGIEDLCLNLKKWFETKEERKRKKMKNGLIIYYNNL